MKNILLFLFTIIQISSCGNNQNKNELATNQVEHSKSTSKFVITKDTLSFSTEGYLRKAAFFKNKFYCMFETERENTSRSFKKMVVLSDKGEFIEDVFIPGGIQAMNYYDFKIENDNLYIKRGQFDEENFLLGKYVADFRKVETRQFKIYEDEKYIVHSTCNGEFGGTVFFQDKETDNMYEGSSTCPIIVNKIGEEYYVTNHLGHMIGFASILKIADPKDLEKSDRNFKSNIGSRKNKGIEKLLDTMNFYIPTSFVDKRKLLHIYSSNNRTYIGEIENNELRVLHEFGFTFYPQFNHLTEDRKQILTFTTPENKGKGILIISNNNLNFKFFR